MLTRRLPLAVLVAAALTGCGREEQTEVRTQGVQISIGGEDGKIVDVKSPIGDVQVGGGKVDVKSPIADVNVESSEESGTSVDVTTPAGEE